MVLCAACAFRCLLTSLPSQPVELGRSGSTEGPAAGRDHANDGIAVPLTPGQGYTFRLSFESWGCQAAESPMGFGFVKRGSQLRDSDCTGATSRLSLRPFLDYPVEFTEKPVPDSLDV